MAQIAILRKWWNTQVKRVCNVKGIITFTNLPYRHCRPKSDCSWANIYMSRHMTKPNKMMYAQWRLRLAWASAQSDQSLRCPHEEAWVLCYPWSAQRRLIRLGKCPGWSESSLGAQVILLVLSIGGSYMYSNIFRTSDFFLQIFTLY